MYAIISELDQSSSVVVKNLWARLRDACGLREIYNLPTPHFSWLVAEALDLPLHEGHHSRPGSPTLDVNFACVWLRDFFW
jgi:hypothetical protein